MPGSVTLPGMGEAKKFAVLIVGGGTGGLTVAARLRRQAPHLSIAIVEPSILHFYQPLWTLVGAGIVAKSASVHPQADYIPAGCTWIKDHVSEFYPEQNRLKTVGSGDIEYSYLVVATGMQLRWGRITGMPAALDAPGVCSNYSYDHVEKTWECIRNLKGGTAIFTFPNTPIKCGGAPQKIMYLAEDYLRKNQRRDKTRIIFASAGSSIFAVKKYADALSKIISERGIETLFGHNLISVDAQRQTATFATNSGKDATIDFALLHVTPPMSAPDVVIQSQLANGDGWVDVDKHSLQHKKYTNIFSLGDVSSLPTSRTGAAIRKQAPVLVNNLIALDQGRPPQSSYDGYTSCPLVTGYGRLILAEFDYNNQPVETFPFDQSKERYSMYLLKKHALPRLYWHGMLRGRF